MGILHHIHNVIEKYALAQRAYLLALRGRLPRSRQVTHVPHFLDPDGKCSPFGAGEGCLHALDDSVDGGVANRLCVVRDGPRLVILGTRK